MLLLTTRSLALPALLVAVLVVVATGSAHAQQLFPHHLVGQSNGTVGKTPYVTTTHMVEMRDGTKLHTIVFEPVKDIGKHKAAVLMRTPYGATGLKGLGEMWVDQGFVAVMQDFRGRYQSKGDFMCWFNATSDGADTIHWIKKQSWSNKRVFAQGVSANGIAAYLEEADPSVVEVLLGQYVVVATAELHRTIFQGGAYRYSLIHGWLDGIKELSFEHNFVDNEAFSSFYEPVSMTDKWKDVTAPAVHLTGWYDIFNHEQLRAYEGYQTQSTIGRGLNFLVVVPTGHCPGGEVPWPNGVNGIAVAEALAVALFKTLAAAADQVERANGGVFGVDGVAWAKLSTSQQTALINDVHARTAAVLRQANAPVVQYYVMGPAGASSAPGKGAGPFGNYWAEADALPVGKATKFYLNGTSELLIKGTPVEGAKVSYVYDPSDPVPTLGGNNLLLPQCGPYDQRQLEKRGDVASFTSVALESPVIVSGEMTAQLFVSTNCTDTDFTVKVLDVYPNGTSMMLQDGIVRMRWANDTRAPHLLTPGKVYMAEVSVWTTAYIFNAGHRIRVDISSSNYPRFSANPNTGRPLANNSTASIPAANTIYTGPAYPSRLTLPVLPNDGMPTPLDIDAVHARINDLLASL
ncbi:hypothetical protein PTSG_11110 [Salpingoeca rosetta]|uniref:Xaa-Pro dipeptidyl-peptidase C-terminal domain-containing protein n=1 Tax=Salpingoeca rosetta (strain ATCC 50818 / BSB-021) TaxID=946362 RepID=F2US61_SALR5|nr:uncharacterized protein PTSG_11110 [Salpingoeca rosetta]EGD80466.1 hypothetical protein PTSG_11110 [Salpingoeca rosetta]|eukprot:XP_004988030.1 hypothetical protein PTSG_11110 [Salpingoeca rosetta]